MEIALVSLFDAAAAAEPIQGQTPEEPFRDFLGVAVARDPEAGESPAEGEPAADTDPEREDATSPAPLPDTPAADAVSSLEWNSSTTTSAEFIPEETVAAPPAPQELPAVAAAPEDFSSAPVPSQPSAEQPDYPETDSPSAATHPTTETLPVSEFADRKTAPEAAPETAPATADPTVPQAVPIPIHGSPVVAVAAATDDTLMQTAVAPPLPPGVVSAEARETSPQQRSRSELVRTRAADEFQGRAGADRLWGYWLRNRGAEPARPAGAVVSGAEQGIAPGGEGLPRGAGDEPGWSKIVHLVNPAGGLPAETRSTNPVEAVPRTGELRTEPATSAVNPGTQTGAGTEPAAGVRTTPVVRQPATSPPSAPRQVANAVRVAVLKGGDRITVQLQPETLGKVQVVLVRGDEGLSASFKVENPVTHQALQADAPMLRQALEARGVNVLHVSVELEQGDRQNRDPLARHGGGRKRRFSGAEQQGELPLDDIALRPQPWRPWGFDARA